jgi:TM2 domain-containing membrane protein YozV
MILERLRYAEAKNTIIVTLLGVLIIGAFRIYNETPYRPMIATIYFWCFLLFSIFAIVTAVTAFMPNIKLQYLYKAKEPLPTDSLIYYEHIAKFDDAKQYISAVNRTYFNNEVIPGNLDYDLGAQIILNSRSVYRKSVLSYYAILFTTCAILTPIVGGIYLLFSRYSYWSSDTDSGRTTLKFGRRKHHKEEIKEIRHNYILDFSKYFLPHFPKKSVRNVKKDETKEEESKKEN